MIFKRRVMGLLLSTIPIMGPGIAIAHDETILTFVANDNVTEFSLTDLREMDATTFETTTIWTQGLQEFTGVALHVLLDETGAEGSTLAATAINEYVIEIPVSDAIPGGPIIAYERNGSTMSVREKGPLWIVYPYDSNIEYQSEVTYSRSIWQLDRLELQD